MIYVIIILTLTSLYTLYMGYTDGSNAVATTIVTRAMRPHTAIVVGAVTQLITAVVVYYVYTDLSVAATVGTGMVSSSFYAGISNAEAFIFILSGILSAIVWGILAYRSTLPNSTSHTLMGGIIGAGISAFGFKAILWSNVFFRIILMIALAPIISIVIGYIINKILKFFMRKAHRTANNVFVLIQRVNVVVLCASFAINNVQKSIGIYFLLVVLGFDQIPADVPVYIVFIFAAMLSIGMLLGGYSIVNTVGRKLFKLKPIHSISSQFSTSIVIFLSSRFGIPVSTGQVISSSIMGVGVSERINGVKWPTVKKIMLGWLLTMPFTIAFGAVFYYITRLILGGLL